MSTSAGISREDALTLLNARIQSQKLIAHCLASEAIMQALARHFDQDPEFWGLAGLLHDIDYEMVDEDPQRHGEVGAQLLAEQGVHPDIVNAVRKHNAEGLGLARTERFEYALTCAESITGLIVATALVYPDKKIQSVKPKSITKRMKTRDFARAVSRERIRECEKIGLSLNDFIVLSLRAMADIGPQLGL